MGLYKRGQVWWMRFSYKGRQIRRPTNVTDKKLAEKIYHKVMTQLAESQWLDRLEGEDRTFRELAGKYISEYAKYHKRDWKKDQARLKGNLHPFFGDLIVTEISPKIISAYKHYRYEKGVKAATINRELTVMKHIYTMAIKEWEWCRDNPVKRFSMEKEGQPRDRWLTYDEEKRLLKYCPDWLRDIVTFAIHTGMRQGEILSLKWRNVDLQRGIATLHETKNGERRSIPLNRTSWGLLKARNRVRYLTCENVFTSSVGTPLDSGNLRRAYMEALKKARIEGFTFHDLRHTFATRLV